MLRLQELTSPSGSDEVKEFLKSAQFELAGRTQAWDLGSLLIKPVQRVLKYPLLIKVCITSMERLVLNLHPFIIAPHQSI